MALSLHAVTPVDTAAGPVVIPDGARKVAFRDICAVVTEQEKFALDEPDEAALNQHRAVIDAIFRRQVVLPTPPGVIFRTEHVLTRWMELHYVALNDAMSFVSDRVAMRVHVERAGGSREDAETGSDLAEVAGEVFRDLRRRAVASVPLTIERITGITLSGAFLVERELFREFERAVAEVKAAHPKLSIVLTGPWAPYDFVRMQFGD
ncbi:MAG TPA: GvpL/GvpF family gas vesicle protein [Gemmatimonadaceae bacterium]|nr:GvpL/GvpF family gas vesicle protein [Gemmatimonadaceae bacterium]